MTIQDLCQDALLEIGVLAQGESIQAGDAAFTLGKLQRLLNSWNANRRAVYATTFVTNPLTPSLSPHTTGPTGATWTVTQRPGSIAGAGGGRGGARGAARAIAGLREQRAARADSDGRCGPPGHARHSADV